MGTDFPGGGEQKMRLTDSALRWMAMSQSFHLFQSLWRAKLWWQCHSPFGCFSHCREQTDGNVTVLLAVSVTVESTF